MCGAYAIVNSIQLLTGGETTCVDLFAAIIQRIGDRLPGVVLGGLTFCEFERYVMSAAVAFCATQSITLCYQRAPRTRSLDRYWAAIKAHTECHGAGSIVLGLWGTYNHFTCVKKVTDRVILLIDSVDMQRIHRNAITLDMKKTPRRHWLQSNMTYLLSIKR